MIVKKRTSFCSESLLMTSTKKKTKNVTLFTSGSMLTSMKMEEEGEQGCHQLDDYSYSILEGILPQVIILEYLNVCD